MAELALVSNPRRRRRHRKGKMPAGLARYHAARRKAKKKSHRRRRHASHVAHVAAPRRRRRAVRHAAHGYTVGHARVRRRKLNPRHRRRHHRRHHNPSFRDLTGQIMPTVKAGAWGAAGALGLDALWGLAIGRLPVSVTKYVANPYVGLAVKAVGAVAVGALGSKLARGRGRELAVGAMTVVAHDFLKGVLKSMAPSVFGAGGAVPLGSYLSGSAPIVGTASIPQTYLPFNGDVDTGDDIAPGGPLGSYLSGSSGTSDASTGMFYDDATGY